MHNNNPIEWFPKTSLFSLNTRNNRHGPMCSRCLRGLDERSYGGVDEEVSLVGTEDDDDRSLMDLISNAKIYQSSVKLEVNYYFSSIS